VVKYCAAGQQRHLPLHVDQSTISLTVALNGHDHAKDAGRTATVAPQNITAASVIFGNNVTTICSTIVATNINIRTTTVLNSSSPTSAAVNHPTPPVVTISAAASGVKEEEEVVLPTFAGGGTYFESLGEALVGFFCC